MAGRSFRWPLRGTRGFSATPRSNWKRKPPAPTKQFARQVVRKAGPLQTEWFVDSSLVVDSDYSTLVLAPGGNFSGATSGNVIMASSAYDTNLATSREKVYIESIDVRFRLNAATGTDNAPYHRELQIGLFLGTTEMATDYIGDNSWPDLKQSYMILNEERAKGSNVFALKRVNLEHPADPGSATMWELGMAAAKNFRTVRMTSHRRRLLGEGYQLYWMSNSQCWSLAGGAEASVGGVTGWWSARIKLARY